MRVWWQRVFTRPLSTRERVLLLLVLACLMVSRAPGLILEPRLWTDDGTTYFAYAYHHSALQSLIFVSSGVPSYLHFAANLASTIAAHLVPLEWAPWPMTVLPFVLQLVPFIVVLFGRSYFWNNTDQRLVTCLIVLFSPAAVWPDVWLNACNSQVFCGLIAFTILCEDTTRLGRRHVWIYSFLLLFCGLSGPYTAFLAPAFVLKAWLEKSTESRRHAAIALAAASLQATIHLWTRLAIAETPARLAVGNWSWRLVNTFYHHIVRAVLGHDLSPVVADAFGLLRAVEGEERHTALTATAGWASLFLIGLTIWWLARRPKTRMQHLLSVSLIVTIASTFLLTVAPRGRYAFLAGLILLLSISVCALDRNAPGRRLACRIALGVALVTGVATYWRDVPREYSPLGRAPGKPSWPDEVARWRRDPNHLLRIWPYTERQPIRFALSPDRAGGPSAASLYLGGFDLISTGEWSEKRYPVAGLPVDFRVVFEVLSSQNPTTARFRLRLYDAQGELVKELKIAGFGQEDQRLYVLNGTYLLPANGRRLAEVRSFVMALKSTTGEPVRMSVRGLEIGPRLKGTFESFAQVFPPYTAPRRPLVTEATSVMAVDSLLEDRDLVLGPRDLVRSVHRWPDGPSGLRLRGPPRNVAIRYGESPLYPLVTLPFFALLDTHGMVLLNGVVFLTILTIAWRSLVGRDRWQRVATASFLLASAAVAYVFLPRPEALRMLLIFLPALLWVKGSLWVAPAQKSRTVLLTTGLILGVAVFDSGSTILLALGIATDLTLRRLWRQLGMMIASAIVAAVCWLGILSAVGGMGSVYLPSQSTFTTNQALDLSIVESIPEGEPSAGAEGPERTLRRLASEAWSFFFHPHRGLVFCYPFALVGLFLFATSPKDRTRDLLFAVIGCMCACAVWTNAGSVHTSGGLFGSASVAPFYPLFLLLPSRWGARPLVAIGLVAALLLTLPAVARSWHEATGGAYAQPPNVVVVSPDSGEP